MRTFDQTIGSPAGTLTAFIDQWAHIAITFDGSTVRIYLNAEEVASGSFSLGPGLTTGMGLGCKAGNANSNTEIFSGDLDDARIYSRALSAADVKQLLEWTGIAGKAYAPEPAEGQTDVPRDAVLSWTPGEFAAAVNGHTVYLSESFSDVNDGVGGITHSATSYAPAQRLDFETTYYWRVDEVNAPPDSTVFEGNIWSFTTEPVGYPIDGANVTATASSAGQANLGPENTVNGSGLDENGLHSTEATDMWLSDNEPLGGWIQYEFDKVYKLHAVWVWNSNQVFEPLFGFGMKDVTVEYSTNGTDWTALAGVPEFAKAPGTPGYAHDTTVDFDSAVAKVVRLTATSNWGGVLPQFGLSEVRFFSIPVIAREPSPDSGATDVDMNVTLGWRAGRDAATHDVSLSTDEQAVIDGTAPAVSVADASYSSPLDLGSTYYWRQPLSILSWTVSRITTTIRPTRSTRRGWMGTRTRPTAPRSVISRLLLWRLGPFTAAPSPCRCSTAIPAAPRTQRPNARLDAADIAKLRWNPWSIDLASLGVNLASITKLALGIDGNGAGGTLYVDDIVLYRLAPEVVVPSEELWIEAEAADTITAPMQTYDDPAASGGKYISTDESVGDEYDNPPADGVATYTFAVAGGTYNNSFWVRIQGATTPAETELHSSGWVRWNDPPDLSGWFWNDVFSDDDDQDATVLFTMPAGTYVLEIVRREAGAMLDVIVIS
ncbi:MAG: LamG-like jellyroll fold domain-containing protein, partial [Planctomycetota bacterium]